MDEPHLITTRWGFRQYQPTPSPLQLREHYASRYYQQGRGSYAVEYSPQHRQWIELRARLLTAQAAEFHDARLPRTHLDAGCGEGWLMRQFLRDGWNTTGVDFSQAGIQQHNPELAPRLRQGDLYEELQRLAGEPSRFSVITACNVMEHVTDPEALAHLLRRLVTPGGQVVITVPNDFSALHDHLLEQHLIDEPFWLAYPEHLSYFNRQSMQALLADAGFQTLGVLADFPIDLLLLNDNSNYVRDRAKGPASHEHRIRQDLLMARIAGEDKLRRYYAVLADMGLGRNLTFFARG